MGTTPMVNRPCPTKMIIYIPTDETITKAWVILQHPHNHPMHPKSKPSFTDKQRLTEAIHATGDLAGLTVRKLTSGMSTFVRSTFATISKKNAVSPFDFSLVSGLNNCRGEPCIYESSQATGQHQQREKKGIPSWHRMGRCVTNILLA